MAQIQAAPIFNRRNDVIAYEWVNLTESDTADAVEVPFHSDKTFEVTGNFGTGGTLRAQGTIDEDQGAFHNLTDAQGNAIGLTSAGVKEVLQNVAFFRPAVSAGTGVSVTARLMAR